MVSAMLGTCPHENPEEAYAELPRLTYAPNYHTGEVWSARPTCGVGSGSPSSTVECRRPIGNAREMLWQPNSDHLDSWFGSAPARNGALVEWSSRHPLGDTSPTRRSIPHSPQRRWRDVTASPCTSWNRSASPQRCAVLCPVAVGRLNHRRAGCPLLIGEFRRMKYPVLGQVRQLRPTIIHSIEATIGDDR
jgi:hypothetical protein